MTSDFMLILGLTLVCAWSWTSIVCMYLWGARGCPPVCQFGVGDEKLRGRDATDRITWTLRSWFHLERVKQMVCGGNRLLNFLESKYYSWLERL